MSGSDRTAASVDAANVASGIARVMQGDPDRMKRLRANLAVFARRQDDPDVRDLVSDVLAGRRDVGEVLRSDSFNRVGERHLDNLVTGLDDLTPEERAEALDRSRPPTSVAELIALRDAGDPGDGWAPEDAQPADPDGPLR